VLIRAYIILTHWVGRTPYLRQARPGTVETANKLLLISRQQLCHLQLRTRNVVQTYNADATSVVQMEVVEITMAEKISCGYVNIEGTSNPFELQKSIFRANPSEPRHTATNIYSMLNSLTSSRSRPSRQHLLGVP
jgi:hypothetical protein